MAIFSCCLWLWWSQRHALCFLANDINLADSATSFCASQSDVLLWPSICVIFIEQCWWWKVVCCHIDDSVHVAKSILTYDPIRLVGGQCWRGFNLHKTAQSWTHSLSPFRKSFSWALVVMSTSLISRLMVSFTLAECSFTNFRTAAFVGESISNSPSKMPW